MVARYDAVAAADVFSSPCMKQEAYQEFINYAISIPALWSQRMKEMMQNQSPRVQKKPTEL